MISLVENDDRFRHMDILTANIVNELTKADLKLQPDEEGEIDMCVAIAEMREESRNEGIQLGIKEGIKEGTKKGLNEGENLILSLIQKLISDGRMSDIEKISQDREYLDSLLSEYGLK